MEVNFETYHQMTKKMQNLAAYNNLNKRAEITMKCWSKSLLAMAASFFPVEQNGLNNYGRGQIS